MHFKPKIAHEGPKQFLESISMRTDYDYGLVHLYKKDPEYRKFLNDKVKEGREVILDNSLFELGKAFKGEEYDEEIRALNPTYYVVPDVFNKYKANLNSAKEFLGLHKGFKSEPIIAIHGETFDELLSAYKEVTSILESQYPKGKVAIPFGSKAFEQYWSVAYTHLGLWEHRLYMNEVLYRKSRNRYYFLEMLASVGYINRNIKHHLLGNYSPIELSYYKESIEDFSFIDSVDTSHPVALGLECNSYAKVGLYYKPVTSIDPCFYNEFNSSEQTFIFNNIFKFREICMGDYE
jgi:hypothetical protein